MISQNRDRYNRKGWHKNETVHCHVSLSKNKILQKHELCSATMWTPPLESTHREPSFEWSHLKISLDGSGLRSFLTLVKFTFGSERVNRKLKDKSTVSYQIYEWDVSLLPWKSNSREFKQLLHLLAHKLCHVLELLHLQLNYLPLTKHRRSNCKISDLLRKKTSVWKLYP